MVARFVLSALQLVVGYFAAFYILPHIQQYNSSFGGLNFGVPDIFILAVIYAVMIWLVGGLGALVSRDVSRPMPSTFLVASIFAFAMAAMTLVPEAVDPLNRILQLPITAYPLIGAVVGYAISR